MSATRHQCVGGKSEPPDGDRRGERIFSGRETVVDADGIREPRRNESCPFFYDTGQQHCGDAHFVARHGNNRRNQVWSTDISHIRMVGGFMYLYAIIDVYSRYIVGWKLSNTLSADNVHEMVKESIRKFGALEIINTDQGSQYTTKAWEDLLKENGILISMDGRGRCKDNIWIERFRRTVKQEYVYINPTVSVVELRQGISDYIESYNYERPHQSIEDALPARSYGLIA